jgi:phosphoglycerate dehydrogenase-like enzyme
MPTLWSGAGGRHHAARRVAARIRRGRRGVLNNVGREALVDERALFEALRRGDIHAAAASDVWYQYPAGPGERAAPGTLPFGQLRNVLMTPHSSGITTDTFMASADDIAANIGRLSRGELLRDVVAAP